MRSPRDFFKPLAIGAPDPAREIPFKPSRMIHFLDFSNEKMAAKAPDIARQTDVLLGNLEDAVPVDRKEAARRGLIDVARSADLGDTRGGRYEPRDPPLLRPLRRHPRHRRLRDPVPRLVPARLRRRLVAAPG